VNYVPTETRITSTSLLLRFKRPSFCSFSRNNNGANSADWAPDHPGMHARRLDIGVLNIFVFQPFPQVAIHVIR